MAKKLEFYGDSISGNCYKLQLACSELDIDCTWHEMHILSGGDRFARAVVLQWMFFEQYSHEPYIGASRFIVKYLGSPADRQADSISPITQR